MATIQQQKDDEDQKNASGPTTVTGSGGTGSSGSGAAAPVSQVQQNAAPQQNQGYTDVASYLNANQEGSQKLGEQVSSNLTNRYNQTKSGIDTSYNQFTNDVSKGYVPQNTDLINQVAADPYAASNNANTREQFQKQLNDSYQGPTSWGDYGTQLGKVQEANQYGSLATTPGGLNVYTQEVEGQNGGPMSQGINQLDTLLLGGNPNAVGQIRQAADPYKTLNDYINQQNMGANNAVQSAQTEAQNASQNALNAFTGDNGALTSLNTSIRNNASESQARAIKQQNDLLTAIQGLYTQPVDTTAVNLGTYGGGSTPWVNSTNYDVGDLNPDSLAALGINQDQWNALRSAMQAAGTTQFHSGHNFGANSGTSQIDLSNWLSGVDPNNITAATTATPEQYAKMAAIQNLLGDKMPQDMAINPMLSSQAGTAPSNITNFDYQGALDYANQLENYQEKSAQEMAQQLTGAADLAHAQSQHNHGFLGGLKEFATHPWKTLAVGGNPLSYASNIAGIMKGKGPDPTNINQTGAKVVAPIAGSIIGGIYGGPVGAMAGGAAGNELGGTLENLGGKKPMAHGGVVKKDDLDEYLSKRMA